ncbi:MAG: hypothetical protein AAF235_11015, partial [Planctomycetota bacterium]
MSINDRNPIVRIAASVISLAALVGFTSAQEDSPAELRRALDSQPEAAGPTATVPTLDVTRLLQSEVQTLRSENADLSAQVEALRAAIDVLVARLADEGIDVPELGLASEGDSAADDPVAR